MGIPLERHDTVESKPVFATPECGRIGQRPHNTPFVTPHAQAARDQSAEPNQKVAVWRKRVGAERTDDQGRIVKQIIGGHSRNGFPILASEKEA